MLFQHHEVEEKKNTTTLPCAVVSKAMQEWNRQAHKECTSETFSGDTAYSCLGRSREIKVPETV